MKIKVLSCVPDQLYSFDDKIAWIRTQIKKYNPDILVTPQEYFGGVYIMPSRKAFHEKDLLPILQKISIETNTALIVGLVEKFTNITYYKEAIWFIDKDGRLKGKLFKIALPRYDHILTNGYGNIEPETDFFNRFKVFDICGLKVSAIFCWEVFSNLLWTGLGLLKPDLVFSMIKFGVNAWPIVRKENKQQVITDFGYASYSSDIWEKRLIHANLFEVKCPIVCSTNSWSLRPISKPLCGTVSLITSQHDNTVWTCKKEDKFKDIPEKIIIDEFDVDKIRYGVDSKFLYKDMVGEFPPFSIGEYTMLFKINRLEERLLLKKEQEKLIKFKKKSTNKIGFFDI